MEGKQQARTLKITIISGQNISVDRNSKTMLLFEPSLSTLAQ